MHRSKPCASSWVDATATISRVTRNRRSARRGRTKVNGIAFRERTQALRSPPTPRWPSLNGSWQVQSRTRLACGAHLYRYSNRNHRSGSSLRIDAVAIDTVEMKLKDGTLVTLSDVLYIPDNDGSLISVSKLAEKNVVAEFIKNKCGFRFKNAPTTGIKRFGRFFKLETAGVLRNCLVARAPKEAWDVMHAHLGYIPLKRKEQLQTAPDRLPGCCRRLRVSKMLHCR